MQKTPQLDKIRRCLKRPISWRLVCVFSVRFCLILFSIYYFQSVYYDPDFELALYLRSNATHITDLPLLHHSQYQARRCTPVTRTTEKEDLKLAKSLILTAQTNNQTTLTAQHVNQRACLIVTKDAGPDFLVMLNPRLVRSSMPIRVKETSLLCKNPTVKTTVQNLTFYYTNGTLNGGRVETRCPSLACSFALSHALEILDGKFNC